MIFPLTLVFTMLLKRWLLNLSEKKHLTHIHFPIIESLALFLVVIFTHSFNLETDYYLLLLWLMSLMLSLSDYLYYLVEPTILYSLALFSFLGFCLTHPVQLSVILLPLIVIFSFYLLQLLLPNSIGGGDVKLIFVYAFFITYEQLLYLILIASSLGLLFIGSYFILTKQSIKRLPFVPFLAMAFIIVTLFGK